MNCPYCKAPVKEGDIFCQTCGKKLEQSPNKIPEAVNKIIPMPTVSTNVNAQPNSKRIQEYTKKVEKESLFSRIKQIFKNMKHNKYIIPILFIVILISLITNIITIKNKEECPKCSDITTPIIQDKYAGMSDYKLGVYTFKAPTTWTLSYNETNDTIKFMDEDKKYLGEIQIENELYSTIRGNIGNRISELEKEGYTIDNYDEQSYDSTAVYVIDGIYKNKKQAMYLVNGGKTTIIATVTLDDENEFTAKNSEIKNTISTFKNVTNIFK